MKSKFAFYSFCLFFVSCSSDFTRLRSSDGNVVAVGTDSLQGDSFQSGVATDSVLAVNFSTALDNATVTSQSAYLIQGTSGLASIRAATFNSGICNPANQVSADIDISGMQILWSPESELVCETTYYLCITKDVRFSDGARFDGATYSFTTEACEYSVTRSGTNVSITPAGDQTVTNGDTLAFTVTANTGYTRSNTVGGTCPAGSWSGDTYTTGAITEDCSVSFSADINSYSVSYNANSATGGSVPADQTQNYNSTVTVRANSGSLVRTGYTLPDGIPPRTEVETTILPVATLSLSALRTSLSMLAGRSTHTQ